MLNAALAHGKTTIVIAMRTAAITQPTAIHRPPKTIHSMLSKRDEGTLVSFAPVGHAAGSFVSSCINHCSRDRDTTRRAHRWRAFRRKSWVHYFRKIVGSQHHGSVGLCLFFEELTRCSLFNDFPQPHELIYALIWLHAA